MKCSRTDHKFAALRMMGTVQKVLLQHHLMLHINNYYYYYKY